LTKLVQPLVLIMKMSSRMPLWSRKKSK